MNSVLNVGCPLMYSLVPGAYSFRSRCRKRESVEKVQIVPCREVVLVDVGQTTGHIYLFLNQFITVTRGST